MADHRNDTAWELESPPSGGVPGATGPCGGVELRRGGDSLAPCWDHDPSAQFRWDPDPGAKKLAGSTGIGAKTHGSQRG